MSKFSTERKQLMVLAAICACTKTGGGSELHSLYLELLKEFGVDPGNGELLALAVRYQNDAYNEVVQLTY